MKGITKEHIPPRSFFPDGEKDQLLTVRSCKDHNNRKAIDDQYVLAHICMNASPSNRAQEVFNKKISPQLSHNNGAFKKMLSENAVSLPNGSVIYNVEIDRFDDFFTALSCGIIYKTCEQQLPKNYSIGHLYSNFSSKDLKLVEEFEQLIPDKPMKIFNFGKPNTQNERIYSVEVFGIREFKSNLTIVHLFYEKFKVVSLLTNRGTH